MRARTPTGRGDAPPAVKTVAIVGAGFSGISLAVHLRDAASEAMRISIFDPTGFGLGPAYSTPDPAHLLNGVAGNLSAVQAELDQFAKFLERDAEAREHLDPGREAAGQFVPRLLYGRYLRYLLAGAERPSRWGATVVPERAEIVGLRTRGQRIELETGEGERVLADRAVLALGNLPPREICTEAGSHRVLQNPWRYSALEAIGKDDSVLVVGTGQSMVDTVMSLDRRGHRGSLRAISRRGLTPAEHRRVERRYPLSSLEVPTSLAGITRYLRSEIAAFTREGGDWRAVVNALRPITQPLWQGFSTEEKRRFLRHLAPFWSSHRHRIPPAAWRKLAALRGRGALEVLAGRILSVEEREHTLRVVLRSRDGASSGLEVDWIVNCTGPGGDYLGGAGRLGRALLEEGLARPDSLGLGLAVSDTGALLDAEGRASERLFTLGPPTRGTFLETDVVRDIRNQCAALASRLSGRPAPLVATPEM